MANINETPANFSAIAAKSPEGNIAYIKIGEGLTLSAGDYQEKIYLHAGSREKINSDTKTRVEITDEKSESLPKDTYIDVEIAPQNSGKYSFNIYNPYPKVSLSFWIQGQETKLEAGGKLEVFTKDSFEYAPFTNGELGTIYAMIGQNNYLKIYANQEGQTVIKTAAISKANANFDGIIQESDSQDSDNQDVDVVWNTEPQKDTGVLTSISFGTDDLSQVKIQKKGNPEQFAVLRFLSPQDSQDKVAIKPLKGSVWTKAEGETKAKSISGETTLLPFSYFVILDKVYFYVGIRGSSLKILEVRK